jgi:hypothetical protein
MHGKGAAIAEGVKHSSAWWYQGMQGQVVLHLVEIETRLMAFGQVHLKGETMLVYVQGGREGLTEEAVVQL